MKTNKILSALLAVLLALSLCGCQLAQKEMGEEDATSHIIGFFITTEYLDLFDAEAYLQDQFIGSATGDVNFSENSDRYDGRYYATLMEITNFNGSESNRTHYRYEFPGLKGFPFYSANHPDSVEMSDFLASCYDSAISDIHLSIFVTDAGERVELDGTLNLSTSYVDKPIFLNPVYQTDNGSVYVESGDSVERGGEIDEGPFVTNTYSDTATTTNNGKSESTGNTIRLSIAFVHPPEKIILLQMDANNEIVKSSEFEPGEMPESLTPEKTTDYIIVETHKTDSAGEKIVTRELVNREDGEIHTNYALGDGICVNQCTLVEW